MLNNIGLARGTVKLVLHDPSWQARFAIEAKLLQKKLDISDDRIQHVGSTAIPGILAKPIVDIAIPVDSLAIADEWVKPLAELGYWNKGAQPDMPERRFFAKGSEEKRTVYLHVVTNVEYKSLIVFRDTLRANAELAKEYSGLKAKLASSLASDRAEYTRQKNDFIQNVLAHLGPIS